MKDNLINSGTEILGSIVSIYSNILKYEAETKRLEVEILRIQEEARVKTQQIDRAFQLGMKKLENERIALISNIQMTAQHINEIRMTKQGIEAMRKKILKKILASNTSLKDKKLLNKVFSSLGQELLSHGN